MPVPKVKTKLTKSELTLFFPGDGVKQNSNTATYKSIKNFKCNNNGTIEFDTVEFGHITTPAMWRLKEPHAGDEQVAPAVRNRY